MVYKRKIRLTLVDGPSKIELLDALKYAYEKQHSTLAVTFKFDRAAHNLTENDPCFEVTKVMVDQLNDMSSKRLHALVTGLAYEDSSGKNFLTRGSIDLRRYNGAKVSFDNLYTGFFDTDDRQGWLEAELCFADGK